MAGAAIGLRRLISQRVLGEQLERPADVVRWLGAVQAQDYGQSLWAIGSRLRRGTIATVERAIAERQIVRTWLMRGTIHFAAPEDVRWLLALCAPRLAVAEERRRTQLGHHDRPSSIAARELLVGALAGDRRLSRPEVVPPARATRASRRPGSGGTTSSCGSPVTGSSASGRCRASSRRSSCSTTGRRGRRPAS